MPRATSLLYPPHTRAVQSFQAEMPQRCFRDRRFRDGAIEPGDRHGVHLGHEREGALQAVELHQRLIADENRVVLTDFLDSHVTLRVRYRG